jgi:dihydropteroate synthase
MSRPTIVWKFGGEALRLGERTFLAGAVPLNASDAGAAVAHALRLEQQGADFIELQADVWHPGKAPVSAEAELLRIVPVIKKLVPRLTVPLAVETSKAEVARRAVELGARIIADPSTLTFDPELARVAAEGNAGFILRHLRGVPEQWPKLGTPKDIIQAVMEELNAAVSRAARAGLPKSSIVVDPGFGLGKRKEQNSLLLADLGIFHRMKVPLMVCVSGQSFVSVPATEPSAGQTCGMAAAAVLKGAHMIRLDDIASVRDSILAADGLLTATGPAAPPLTGVHKTPSAAPPRVEPPEEPKRRPLRPPVKR